MREIEILLESIDDVKNFVQTMAMFDGDFEMVSGKYVVDAKSILGVFCLDLSKPVTLRIDCDESKMDDVLKKIEKYKKMQEEKSDECINRLGKMAKESDIYKEIAKRIARGNFTLDSNQWTLLEKSINETYPNFTETLRSFYDVSQQELRVCLMIKMGIAPGNIAKFTNHSKEAINSTRGRLYAKVFKEPASAPKWDEFIKTL